MRRWHFSLLFSCPYHGDVPRVVFFFKSNQIKIKLQSRFGDSVSGQGSVKTKAHRRRGRDGRGSIWTFCPLTSKQIGKRTPALSLYAVVDFSPTSPPPPAVTVATRVRFLGTIKRNALAMSQDPKGVSERG